MPAGKFIIIKGLPGNQKGQPFQILRMDPSFCCKGAVFRHEQSPYIIHGKREEIIFGFVRSPDQYGKIKQAFPQTICNILRIPAEQVVMDIGIFILQFARRFRNEAYRIRLAAGGKQGGRG